MARIKIKDLPKDRKISKAEMKRVTGGLITGGLNIPNPYKVEGYNFLSTGPTIPLSTIGKIN